MDAAVDIRPTYSAMAFASEVAPIHAQVWGQPAVALRWNQVTRIPVPAGQVAVGVWMKWVTKAHMGLCHAVLELPPGQVVGLEWKAPGTIFSTGRMVVADLAAPTALAAASSTTPPPDLGPQRLGPPHPTKALAAVPLVAPVAHPAATAPAAPAGQWAPDPTGRFVHRWWDGARWTDAVSDGTTTSSDPI